MTAHQNPEIDALRALAVIGVIGYHFVPERFPGGYLGVDVFFLISGFVVTRRCLEQDEAPFVVFLRNFWTRRFWRLFPSLVSVVIAGLLMTVLVDPTPTSSLRTGLFGLLGLANIQQFAARSDYFVEQTGLNGFTHLWSLGVEEQFYLIFPVLFYLSCRQGTRTRRLLLLAVPAVVSLGLFLYLSETNRTNAAFFLFPFRFWQLAVGVLVAVLSRPANGHRGKVNSFAKGAGVLIICAQQLAEKPTGHLGSLLATFATAVILTTMNFDRTKFSYVIKTLAIVGRRSYSLYLVHWVLLVLFRLTIGLNGARIFGLTLLTLIVAEANHRHIEVRFRRYRGSVRGTSTFGFGAASITALLLVISVTGNNFMYSGNRQDESALLPRAECVKSDSKRWLVGDSHANGYADILSRANNGDCLQIRDGVTGDFFLFQLVGSNPRTIVFMEEGPFLESLSLAKPQELWIINYLQGFFQDQQIAYPSADWSIGSYARPDGRQLDNHAQALQFRLDQYRSVLAKASELGTQVFIELPPPDFDWVGQGGLEWHDERQMCRSNWFSPGRQSRFSDICDMYRTPVVVERRIVESRRKHIVEGLEALADEFPNLHLIDPLDALCSLDVCSTHLEGIRLFEDDDHYSVAGEKLIADQLPSLIR